jgi:serine/threonine-protein kinase RsbW
VPNATTSDHPASHVVRLVIPAKPEYIGLGRLALTGLARLRPLSAETLADLKLALTEACTNSVRHAYDGSEGIVEILYELHPDRLVIDVSDTGDGFDSAEERSEADELSEGGLGLAIIRALADELEITARNGNGARLRFVKRLV